jgi:putative hemolysin
MRSTMHQSAPAHAWHKLALFRRLRELYGRVQSQGHTPTPERLLEAAGVRWRVDYAGLGRMPQDGPVLALANGTFGLREGLVLAAAVSAFRKDTKIVASYLFGGLPELDPLLVAIDPWAYRPGRAVNRTAMRAAAAWLSAGHVLAGFPAGDRIGTDGSRWSTVAPRLARIAWAPIVPVFFHAAAPGEIELHIGDPVEPAGIVSLPPRDAAAYLRWKTEQLAPLREPALRVVPRMGAPARAGFNPPGPCEPQTGPALRRCAG